MRTQRRRALMRPCLSRFLQACLTPFSRCPRQPSPCLTPFSRCPRQPSPCRPLIGLWIRAFARGHYSMPQLSSECFDRRPDLSPRLAGSMQRCRRCSPIWVRYSSRRSEVLCREICAGAGSAVVARPRRVQLWPSFVEWRRGPRPCPIPRTRPTPMPEHRIAARRQSVCASPMSPNAERRRCSDTNRLGAPVQLEELGRFPVRPSQTLRPKMSQRSRTNRGW